MRIPETVLDDILSRVDIAALISEYIPLKRAGRNFKAVCPFHREKTPSFMVSPDRQIYHCFGCNSGGNAFNFLMQYEHLEFIEAVKILAKKAGVILPESQPQDSQVVSLAQQLFKINELAALFFERALHTEQGLKAKKYLLSRGINDSALKLFKLGFAPDAWDALISHLRAKSISLNLLEKAGLIIPKENGGYYDRFRNRIIFPIFDIKSRPLGFGARFIPAPQAAGAENSLPKYINSPETAVYIKGNHLYGLNFAKDAIRQNDYAVIVEGYLDFIMPFQAGLNNIVASLGTALTAEQARLLKRYTHNVVVVYDGDAAGEMASLRALDIFIEEDMNVKVVSLPKGLDPDSFVRKLGIESFKGKVTNAESLFDYKLKILKSRYNSKEIEGKAKIAQDMLEAIGKFKNALIKSEYIKKLAQELSVKEDALLQELRKIKDVNTAYPGINQTEQKNALNINAAEKLLIKLMLAESELISQIKDMLEPQDFQDERTWRIVSAMLDFAKQGKYIEPNSLINHLGDKEASQLVCESALHTEEFLQNEDKQGLAFDCLRRLKSQRLKRQRQRLHEEIAAAQNSGDQERAHKLLREFQHLIKEGVN